MTSVRDVDGPKRRCFSVTVNPRSRPGLHPENQLVHICALLLVWEIGAFVQRVHVFYLYMNIHSGVNVQFLRPLAVSFINESIGNSNINI